MNIAICDDNKIFCDHMREAVEAFAAKQGITVWVEQVYSGEELLAYCKRERYQLVLMDIDLPGMSGMETALAIYKLYATNIVFVSAHIEYASQGYHFDSFHYIYKNQFDNVIEHYLKVYTERERSRSKNILLKCVDDDAVLRLADILYCKSKGHHVYIHMQDAEEPYKFYGKLDEMEAMIEDDCFYRIHQSYLVNFRHAHRLLNYGVRMSNGAALPVTKIKFAMVKQHFITIKGELL